MNNLLVFTTLFPNKYQPRHGIFVETRLRHLLSEGNFRAVVVAPVPWFPFNASWFGRYATFARIPREEKRNGLTIYHPRYLVIPKIGFLISPLFLALSGVLFIRRLIKSGQEFELLDAHYFYPDGVAAALIAKWLDKPVSITARGTDVNLLPSYALPRKMIQWAANRADALISVCQALKDSLTRMGVPEEKIVVLRNGVDLNLFRPSEERSALRKRLGIRGHSVMSVGNLIELKGHHIVIEALNWCPGVTLYIAGSGEEAERLGRLVDRLELTDRVFFLGTLSQETLKDFYSAVDLLVLASSREGWANVLLESLACGTPVVATNIPGTREVIMAPEAGLLVDRTGAALADGIRRVLEHYPNRARTRKYAEKFSWDETTAGQERVFKSIIEKRRHPA